MNITLLHLKEYVFVDYKIKEQFNWPCQLILNFAKRRYLLNYLFLFYILKCRCEMWTHTQVE